MYMAANITLILILLLCEVIGDIPHGGHYSQSLIDSIMEIYTGNSSISSSNRHKSSMQRIDPDTAILVPNYIYPYILLALWIICILIIICCCLHCKCQQAEMMTSYSSNNFELQEVHVLDHPLPHVKGCVCLGCLQRQLTLELQQRRE